MSKFRELQPIQYLSKNESSFVDLWESALEFNSELDPPANGVLWKCTYNAASIGVVDVSMGLGFDRYRFGAVSYIENFEELSADLYDRCSCDDEFDIEFEKLRKLMHEWVKPLILSSFQKVRPSKDLTIYFSGTPDLEPFEVDGLAEVLRFAHKNPIFNSQSHEMEEKDAELILIAAHVRENRSAPSLREIKACEIISRIEIEGIVYRTHYNLERLFFNPIVGQLEISESSLAYEFWQQIVKGEISTREIMAKKFGNISSHSEVVKQDVVKFVLAYEMVHGSAGRMAAKIHFSIDPITIYKWCVELGVRSVKQGHAQG